MRRLLVLSLVTLAIAACSSLATAPTKKAPATASFDCRSGYTSSDGRLVCNDSLGTAAARHP